MVLSFLFPARCVLLMGDEAIRVYDTQADGANLVDAVPWSAEDFEDTLSDLISNRCKGKPVLIVNDMVEQHYRKERVPVATPFDRAAIVKRKLAGLFQNYPVRAALGLKRRRTPGAAKLGRNIPGRMYLFAGMPVTEALKKTMKAIEKSMARLNGFVFLPVESASMVSRLALKIRGTTPQEDMTRWTIFIGQHHGGGLRQIVVRDGELALTRMTPIIDTDLNPDDWARDVVQEFKSTMGYLARFGYEAHDGLDIIVVCGNAPTAYFERHFQTDGTLHLMSSLDVADKLGLQITAQDDIRYADPIHAAWIGQKRSFALPLTPDFYTRIAVPREAVLFCMVLLAGAIAWLGFNIFFDMQKASAVRNDLIYAQQQQAMARTNLEQVKQREDETGYNFLKVENVLDIYERINSGRIDTENLIRRLGIALRPGIWYTSMRVEQSRNPEFRSFDQNAGTDPVRSFYDISLETQLDETMTADEAFRLVNRLQRNLRQLFPDTEVVVTRHIADVNYSARMSGQADEQNRSEERVSRSASLMIRGLSL